MSRDYTAIAAVITAAPIATIDKMLIAEGLAEVFENDNPNFDRDGFMVACGVTA